MKKRLLATSLVSLLIIVFVTGTGVGFLRSDEIEWFLIEKQIIEPSFNDALTNQARQIIRERSIESIDEGVLQKGLVEGSIEGMVKALDDPYADYFTTKDLEHFKMETEGFFYGVGLHVESDEDRVKVVRVIEGSPAERAKIKKNDLIVEVDGESVENSSLDAVVSKIRGPRGTSVTIGVERESSDTILKFDLIRDKINFDNTISKMLPGKIAYFRMHQFNPEGTEKLAKDIADLKQKGAKGMILDLRGNPGGFLTDAVEVAGFFLPEGKVVVVEKPRTGPAREHRTPQGGDTETPLVVLVDNNSASASEIVSATLQEYNRATIVGVKTFGKASVQEVVPMPNNTALKLTIAKYLTPKGKNINKVGVKPDVVIKFKESSDEDADNQLDRAIQELKKLMQADARDAA